MNAVRPCSLLLIAKASSLSSVPSKLTPSPSSWYPMAAPNASFTEGFIPYVIDGEEYKTYYKLFGTIAKDSRPLITLHGGTLYRRL